MHCIGNRLCFRSCHFSRCPLSVVRCPISGMWAWSPRGHAHAVVSDRPVHICLSVCSKTAEGRNFKFGRRALRYSPHMTPDKYFKKVGVVTVT